MSDMSKSTLAHYQTTPSVAKYTWHFLHRLPANHVCIGDKLEQCITDRCHRLPLNPSNSSGDVRFHPAGIITLARNLISVKSKPKHVPIQSTETVKILALLCKIQYQVLMQAISFLSVPCRYTRPLQVFRFFKPAGPLNQPLYVCAPLFIEADLVAAYKFKPTF